MSDLIDRQSAIDTHCELCSDRGKCPDICPDVEVFRLITSAQPDLSAYSDKLWRAAYERGKREAEAERKRGKWTKDNGCPFCGFQPWYERDIHTLSFCPNCGADMRGGDEG